MCECICTLPAYMSHARVMICVSVHDMGMHKSICKCVYEGLSICVSAYVHYQPICLMRV